MELFLFFSLPSCRGGHRNAGFGGFNSRSDGYGNWLSTI